LASRHTRLHPFLNLVLASQYRLVTPIVRGEKKNGRR
jgi:hypothetical protein